MWQYFSVDLINMNDKVICEFVCCHSIMAGMLCNKMYNFFVYHTIWFWLWFQWDNSSDNRQNPVPVRFQKIESVTSLFPPLPSNGHHRSCGDCLEGKGENYQVCWAHFTVLRFIFACIMCIIVYCLHV